MVVPGAEGFTDDTLNHLVLAKVASGKPLKYLAGAAWNRSGDITSRAQWEAYVAAAAKRVASPVKVTISSAK